MSSNNSNKLTLHVRMSTGSRFSIGGGGTNLTKASTVGDVKQLIAENDGSDKCPVERQRLIFRGRILSENSNTLEHYGITENDAVLHLVKGSVGVTPTTASTSTAPTSTTTPPAPTTSSRTTAPTTGPATTTTGTPASGFASLFQDPTLANMQNNPMMQQMMSDPSFMQSMMNSPLFQNPDMLLNLMQANPQMRQLMDSNPQLRHVLSDPQILQQTMQAMRDPSHMATMMRNQDLAMSQIENYPGGFNALRRMYEEVQEPMMEAMSSGGVGATQGTNPSTSAGTSSSSSRGGVAMPNPWGTSTSAGTTPTTATSRAPSSSSSTRSPIAPSTATLPNFSSPDYLNSLMGVGAAGTTPPPEVMEQTLAMLENPTLRNAITSAMLENPQMMQQMMELNPQLRQLRQENPAMAQIMTNPQFLRTMMDPNVMRAMMTLQQSIGNDPNVMQSIQTLQEALGGGSGTPRFPYTAAGIANPPPIIPAGVPSPPVGGLDFSTLLQQTQNMNISHQQQQHHQQQQQRRYEVLVSQLVDMGFDDRESNLRALQATGGNINRAVDYLLENPPSAPTTTTTNNTNTNDTGINDAPPDSTDSQ